jgi:activator of HSP90 ATPase
MTPTIQQSVVLPAKPKELFDTYLDSKKHTAVTGGKARISRKVGAKFTVWNGVLSGHNLLIVPGRMIVQAWRSVHFKRSDPDSILVLEFSKAPGGGRINLVHAIVPPQDHKGVKGGWPKYYWKPWKKYLLAKKKKP